MTISSARPAQVVKVKYCHSDKAQKKFASTSTWLFCKMSRLGVELQTDKSQACSRGPSGDCFHRFSRRCLASREAVGLLKHRWMDGFAMHPSTETWRIFAKCLESDVLENIWRTIPAWNWRREAARGGGLVFWEQAGSANLSWPLLAGKFSLQCSWQWERKLGPDVSDVPRAGSP